VTLTKVTSFLIVSQRRQTVSTGTVSQLRDSYRQALRHNLAFGWWGFPFGLIWTIMALVANRKRLAEVDELVEQGSAVPPGHDA